MAPDAALTRVFAELSIKAHEPATSDEPHDDEAALREALIQAAASRAETSSENEIDENNEAPFVEALSAEDTVEVKALAEEEPPMVEAQADEEPVVEAIAIGESNETECVDTTDTSDFELPEVAAEAVEEVEEEIPTVIAQLTESDAVATEVVEKGHVEENRVEVGAAETVQAAAIEVGRETVPAEGAPKEGATRGMADTTDATESVLAKQAGGVKEARKAAEQIGESVGEDGQTTFFTFEDLNFQPAEDAKPGEEGLGLSLEEAAAVLASEPLAPRREEEKPRMEEIFPAPVQDERKGAESVSVEVASEEAERASRAAVEGSKSAVGKKARLKRITLGVPVLVRGPKVDPTRLREVTQTLIVLPHGAVLSLGATVGLGEVVNLVNLKTGDEAECRVVGMKLGDDGKNQVEIEFLQEVTSFWPVSFPGEVTSSRGREPQMAR